MMRQSKLATLLLTLACAGCAQAPTTLSELTTGSILPKLPSGTSLLPTASASTAPRPPERISGNLYRVYATDRKLDTPEQQTNYALLRAAEATKEMGATHFIIVDVQEGNTPTRTEPGTLAASGGLIRIFRADSDVAPPTGARSADEIITFFGPTFGRQPQSTTTPG